MNEVLNAVLSCHDQNLNIPALILVYVGIDFATSLDRSDLAASTTRADFLDWVNKYLLPGSDLKCNALDLYAARCGWIHNYTSKSSLVQQKKAKEIFYQFGLYDNEDQLQGTIKDPERAVVVHFTRLFNAFRDGLDRWEQDFLKTPEHRARVLQNAERLLHRMNRSS